MQPDRDVDAGQMRIDADRAEVERLMRELQRREPRRGVGAHRVEGDVAEVEQARVADDDVQADGHHDEDEHVDAGRDVGPHAEHGDREHLRLVERIDDGSDERDGRQHPARAGAPAIQQTANAIASIAASERGPKIRKSAISTTLAELRADRSGSRRSQ